MSKLQFLVLLTLSLIILLVLLNPTEAEHRRVIKRAIGAELTSTNSLLQRVKRTWAASKDYTADYHNYRVFSTTRTSERLVTVGVAGMIFPIAAPAPAEQPKTQ